MSDHKLLFVCLGNICRSPMAQGVFAHVAQEAGLLERFHLDSAGTGGWHVGSPPDKRASAAALARGIDISDQRGRTVRREDFSEFDLLLAMDRSNVSKLLAMAPPEHTQSVMLFMDFAKDASVSEVPDPYYGGADGFEHALDLIESASRGLLQQLTGTAGS